MLGKVLEFSGSEIDAVDVAIGVSGIATHGKEELAIVAPDGARPVVIVGAFVGEIFDCLGRPIENGDVGSGRRACFQRKSKTRPVGGKDRVVLGDVRRVGEVDNLTTVRGYGEEVVVLASAAV